MRSELNHKLFDHAARALAILLWLIAAILTSGGLWLIALGGSPYYLTAGLAVAATALFAWRRDVRALTIFGLFLMGTTLWAVAESGLDLWALVARLVAPAVLGLLLAACFWPRAAAMRWVPLVPLAVIAVAVIPRDPTPSPLDGQAVRLVGEPAGGDWLHWGGDLGGSHHSELAQITPANVDHLRPAWTHEFAEPADGKLGNLETTPLAVSGTLYACSNSGQVDAIDGDTGRLIWRFDMRPDLRKQSVRACRGVAYHRAPDASLCAERIVAASPDARLWALDAKTGRPCRNFGAGGSVDLTRGMGEVLPGYYYVSSAPVIARGRIVVGGWVMDGQRTLSPSGVVRAFDLQSGALAWAWDLGRPDRRGEPPAGETYTRGTPNSWAPMSADEALGLVFVPTGNSTPDYFGAHRSDQSERFSSSVVALDLATGNARWSFQTVHHDLWDYDVPAQPLLIDLPEPRGIRQLLIQSTKQGQIFVLDRRTGRPFLPVREVAVPSQGAPGERVSPTQPRSIAMPDFAGPPPSEVRMWGLTPLDQLWCRVQYRRAAGSAWMTPPQLGRDTLQWPGFMGALSWGGVSVDARNGQLIVNANHIPTRHRLLAREEADRLGLKPRGTAGAFAMPGYSSQVGVPYAAKAEGFLSFLGVPCSQPPFGTIAAVDLRSGKMRWQRPFGTVADSGPLGLRSGLPITMGVPNLGGALVTRSGLIFIAATQDGRMRAIAQATGRELWSVRLPAGGQANPMTFRTRSGRQLVVIAAGGKKLMNTRLGNHLVAYALPKELR